MKLYELTGAYIDALRAIEEAEDEVEAERFERLAETLAGSIEEKAENICKLIRTLEVEGIGPITQEIARLQQRRDTLSKSAAWWGNYLFNQLQDAEGYRAKGPLFTAWLQKSPPSCDVTDETAVPAEWWERPPPPPPFVAKARILGHFKETGELVPGVEIHTDKMHLRIK
jgi:hypothetical protein